MVVPPVFPFSRSRYLVLCFVFAHGVVMASLIFVPLPLLPFVLLQSLLLLSLIYYVLRDAWLRLECSWVAMRLERDRVVLINRRGDECAGTVLPTSVVTPYLVVLSVSEIGHRRQCHVILTSDSMAPALFRQLRVVLKWRIASVI